jgi:hypothetical protein
MSDTEDNIPTLNEMIFPGRPEKATLKRPETDSENIQQQTATSSSAQDARPTAKQTHFETFINKQIDEILERRVLAAREEIVRVVMLELRSRLPNANHKDSNN